MWHVHQQTLKRIPLRGQVEGELGNEANRARTCSYGGELPAERPTQTKINTDAERLSQETTTTET